MKNYILLTLIMLVKVGLVSKLSAQSRNKDGYNIEVGCIDGFL